MSGTNMFSAWKKILSATVAASLLVLPAVLPANAQDGNAAVDLRIMATTDLHVNMVNYDYFADKPADDYGFAKTAALIKKARLEAKNSLLFDNGDLIQGNPLGDYVATVEPLQEGEVHPVYKAMNPLQFDAATLGNHEFNYGLDFLDTALAGSQFPYVNANIYVDDHDNDESNDKNMYTPYLILDKKVTDSAGVQHELKVGVIGFVTPQIIQWDKAKLEGKVVAKDIVKTAEKFVPEMKAKGADIVVALAHTGYENLPQTDKMENAVLHLSKVKDISSIIFGHIHKVFPSSAFKDQPGVDLEKGTINGVPSVEPGYWGNNLGIIDLKLTLADGKWSVSDSSVMVQPIYDAAEKKPLVDADQEILDAVKEDHQHTLDYVRGPVGITTAPINSWFALIQDDPSIQIVTNAQKWYVEKHLQGTEYEGIPVLSAGAPFKAGGRQGPNYYTNIPTGDIAIKNVADLYLYSNTVNAVLINGAELKEWLEWSAGQFNQIDPSSTAKQELVNNDFPTYNFDVIDGVTYQIDVTQPAKYKANGDALNPQASRIVNLQFEGKAIDPAQKFVVASNNYRASSSKFANPDGKRIILASPDENRQAVIDYIREYKTIDPAADGNWSLAPTTGSANVSFQTSPDSKSFSDGIDTLSYVGNTGDGYAEYQLKLAVEGAAAPQAPAPEAPAAPGASAAPAPAPVQPAPAAPAAPQPGAAAADTVYTVVKGDTLWAIGLKHRTTWQKLAAYNKLANPNLIHIGQKILIPAE